MSSLLVIAHFLFSLCHIRKSLFQKRGGKRQGFCLVKQPRLQHIPWVLNKLSSLTIKAGIAQQQLFRAHCNSVLSNRTPVGDSLAAFDCSPFSLFFLSSYSSSSPSLFQLLLFSSSWEYLNSPPPQPNETVNSLRGGSAVITTVIAGGAEKRSLGRRKATVQWWPPKINGELEMNQ